jgi:hypothetical protein
VLSKQARAHQRQAALDVLVATANQRILKSELTRNHEVDSSYVTRILKLTALTPNIIESIISGDESDGISLVVRLIHSFPEMLSEQCILFGFEVIG